MNSRYGSINRGKHSKCEDPLSVSSVYQGVADGGPQRGTKSGSRRQGLNDRCRFGQATFIGTHGNERDAPGAAIRPSSGKRVEPAQTGPSPRARSRPLVTKIDLPRSPPSTIA